MKYNPLMAQVYQALLFEIRQCCEDYDQYIETCYQYINHFKLEIKRAKKAKDYNNMIKK